MPVWSSIDAFVRSMLSVEYVNNNVHAYIYMYAYARERTARLPFFMTHSGLRCSFPEVLVLGELPCFKKLEARERESMTRSI